LAKVVSARKVNYFYFETFDATWKESGVLDVEQSWSVYSTNRSYKDTQLLSISE
jgi:exo-beta-1,3-glucanase (GH17 family)